MYRFRSKADADVLMMTPGAEQILRVIGREPAPQGIIEWVNLPSAIAALEQAIAVEAALRKAAPPPGGGRRRDDDEASGAVGIGLQQRAWPLLEMMRRSVAEKADVVWGV